MRNMKSTLAHKCYRGIEHIASTTLARSVCCSHCKGEMEKLKVSAEVCEEALGISVMIIPIDEETFGYITGSYDSFCIMLTLVEGNPKEKKNVVLILKELPAANPLCRENL